MPGAGIKILNIVTVLGGSSLPPITDLSAAIVAGELELNFTPLPEYDSYQYRWGLSNPPDGAPQALDLTGDLETFNDGYEIYLQVRGLAGASPGPWSNVDSIIAPNEYVAPAVTFNGTTQYLTRGAGLTGAPNSKQVTGAFWYKPNADNVLQHLFNSATAVGNNTQRARIVRTAANKLHINVQISSGTQCIGFNTAADILAAGGWRGFIFSYDQADPAKRHTYLGDTPDAGTWGVYDDVTPDWTWADHSIAALANGSGLAAMDLSVCMLWLGQYIDLSQRLNRRLFVDANGKPQDPAVAIAVLGSPIHELANAAATYPTNLGTGGGYTLTGAALSAAATSPSD